MKQFAIIGLLLMAVALVPLERTSACSCVPPGPPEAEMARSSAVFTGRVIEIDEPFFSRSSDQPVTVKFSVGRSWKGPLTEELEIRTAISSASCGYSFEKDREYLVYATGPQGALQVSLCSRTALLRDTSADVAAFGRGITPQDIENSRDDSVRDNLRTARLAVGIIIGLGVGTWLMFRLAPEAK